MTIAVDFDGTLVEHRYPEIGREFPFAFSTLRKFRQDGNKLILWTVREGRLLDEAIAYCRERGVEFDAVNGCYPDSSLVAELDSRKLKASVFIDDRNLGGLPCIEGRPGVPDWSAIYRIVSTGETLEQYYREKLRSASGRSSLRSRLFGKR